MASKIIASGEIILQAGQPVESFWYITSGLVKASFGGGTITLHKGDIVGLIDFNHDSHFFTYTALEETHLASYGTPQQLIKTDFLSNKPDHMVHLTQSMNHYLLELVHNYHALEKSYQSLYDFLLSSNAQYKKICGDLHVVVKELASIEELEPLEPELVLPDWQVNFQKGIHNVLLNKDMQAAIAEYADSDKVTYETTNSAVGRDNLDSGRAEMAFALEKVGDISEPFVSANGDGYYIVKLTAKAEDSVSYESIWIRFTMFDQKMQELREEEKVHERIKINSDVASDEEEPVIDETVEEQ